MVHYCACSVHHNGMDTNDKFHLHCLSLKCYYIVYPVMWLCVLCDCVCHEPGGVDQTVAQISLTFLQAVTPVMETTFRNYISA